MREADFEAFSAMLDDVAGLYPRGVVSAGQKAMFFRALAEHTLIAVQAGFDAHVKDPARGRFLPMPADVIAQLEGLAADDGRPGVEEAWASALWSADESNTVVWTEEMAEAWKAAKPVLDRRDQVGARMAFKEVYTRLIDEARRAWRAPVWVASLGFDVAKRDEAIAAAAARGRIAPPEKLALPAPEKAFEMVLAAAEAPETVQKDLAAIKAMPPKEARQWAHALRAKEKAGASLTEAQRTAWRVALDGAPSKEIELGKFEPVDPRCLPPAMRKEFFDAQEFGNGSPV